MRKMGKRSTAKKRGIQPGLAKLGTFEGLEGDYYQLLCMAPEIPHATSQVGGAWVHVAE